MSVDFLDKLWYVVLLTKGGVTDGSEEIVDKVEYQIFPLFGEKVIGNIAATDLKEVVKHWMGEGYAYTTVKKVYIVLNEYFRYLTQRKTLSKNPMNSVLM